MKRYVSVLVTVIVAILVFAGLSGGMGAKPPVNNGILSVNDIQAELESAAGPINPDAVEIEEVAVRPRKSDITAQPPVLVWVPS